MKDELNRNLFGMSDEEIKELNEKLTLIAGKLGYASYQFIVFNPMKSMDEEKRMPVGTLSGFISEEDIYKFGDILISMLHTLADKGYVARKEQIPVHVPEDDGTGIV